MHVIELNYWDISRSQLVALCHEGVIRKSWQTGAESQLRNLTDPAIGSDEIASLTSCFGARIFLVNVHSRV